VDRPYQTPPGPEGTVPCRGSGSPNGTICFQWRSYIRFKYPVLFMYPWPVGNFDYAMDDALDIAMNYLLLTGNAVLFKQAQATAARAIVTAWQAG
jgi:hypothetical protein